MITAQTVLDQLTGNDLFEALEAIMTDHFKDFAPVQSRYIDVIAALQESLGNNAAISPKEEMTAIRQQTVSNLLFSGLLGLKANWDHFIDPVAKNFMDVDAEIYLREETAHRLPAYADAQETRNLFYAQLSPNQQKLYEDVNAYFCYLETVGPKLAHYYGYMLGNDLLQRVVPGYHPDPVLTIKYTAMLESYFGKSFSDILSTHL